MGFLAIEFLSIKLAVVCMNMPTDSAHIRYLNNN